MIAVIPIESFAVFANYLDHPERYAFDRKGNLVVGGEADETYWIDSGDGVQQVARLSGFCRGPEFSSPGATVDALRRFNQLTKGTSLPRLSPQEIEKIAANPNLSCLGLE